MSEKYKIVEWNIHKMSRSITVETFVITRILRDNPDIIVLVEYKKDNLIEECLNTSYFFDSSIGKKGNDVLIAIKKEIVDKGSSVFFNKNFFEVSLGVDQPTVLDATFMTKAKKKISIIGLRYVQGGEGLKVSKHMKSYLNKIKHSFACIGDFNVLECRMPIHFEEYYHGNYDGSKESSSVVMLNNFQEGIITGFDRLDHLIYNSNIELKAQSYSWDFISLSDVYPSYDKFNVGYTWKIPAAYPDHAFLECDFTMS